jgi:hypothetical protein
VTGNNVTIRNVVVDGNKAAGATAEGIRWSGTGGTLENSTVSNCRVHGVYVSGALTCRNVTSSGHGSAFGDASGFFATGAGSVNLDVRCVGASNTQAGVLINTSATGCAVNGTFFRNAGGRGVDLRRQRGLVGLHLRLRQRLPERLADQAVAGIAITDWKFGTIIGVDQGKTAGSRRARTSSSRAARGSRSGRSSAVAVVVTGWRWRRVTGSAGRVSARRTVRSAP